MCLCVCMYGWVFELGVAFTLTVQNRVDSKNTLYLKNHWIYKEILHYAFIHYWPLCPFDFTPGGGSGHRPPTGRGGPGLQEIFPQPQTGHQHEESLVHRVLGGEWCVLLEWPFVGLFCSQILVAVVNDAMVTAHEAVWTPKSSTLRVGLDRWDPTSTPGGSTLVSNPDL